MLLVLNFSAACMCTGVMPPLLATGVVNGILFSSVGTAKRLQGLSSGDQPTIQQAFVSGAFGGGCTCFISVPAELVKCRQQVEVGRVQTSFIQIAQQIVAKEGAMGLTTGWWSTVARDVWSYGVYFSVYDYVSQMIKQTLNERYASDTTTMPTYMTDLGILTAGSLAGIAAWTCSYPIDTVREVLEYFGDLLCSTAHLQFLLQWESHIENIE